MRLSPIAFANFAFSSSCFNDSWNAASSGDAYGTGRLQMAGWSLSSFSIAIVASAPAVFAALKFTSTPP